MGKTKSQGAGVGSNPQTVALAELESAGGTRPKARRLPVFLSAGGPILAGIAAWAYFHAQRSTLLRDPPPIITKTIEKLPASRPPAHKPSQEPDSSVQTIHPKDRCDCPGYETGRPEPEPCIVERTGWADEPRRFLGTAPVAAESHAATISAG